MRMRRLTSTSPGRPLSQSLRRVVSGQVTSLPSGEWDPRCEVCSCSVLVAKTSPDDELRAVGVLAVLGAAVSCSARTGRAGPACAVLSAGRVAAVGLGAGKGPV